MVLTLIIFSAAFPLVVVYFWFRLAKINYSLVLFLITILPGLAAFFPALILQNLLAFPIYSGRIALFYQYFVRIALTEELSRLLMLFIFFLICSRFKPNSNFSIFGKQSSYMTPSYMTTSEIIKMGTAAGLVAGLGFAMLENAIYAASNINLLLFRLVTAVLHGACGSRIGAATVMFRSSPVKAVMHVLAATAIHGLYNLMVTLPGISSVVAVLIALSAFAIAMVTITSNSQSAENLPDKTSQNY